jgi:hypothetical protein
MIHQILEPVNLPVDHPGVAGLRAAFIDALGRAPESGCPPGPVTQTS